LLRAFPLSQSAEFDNTPWLIGSRTAADGVPVQRGRQEHGDCRPGDHLWLMTDALARWVLTEVEANHRPWLHVEGLLDDREDFRDWVERLRGARLLRNDDTTLLAVRL